MLLKDREIVGSDWFGWRRGRGVEFHAPFLCLVGLPEWMNRMSWCGLSEKSFGYELTNAFIGVLYCRLS